MTKIKKYKRYSNKIDYVKRMAEKMKKKQTWPEREFEKMLKEIDCHFDKQKIVLNKIFDFYLPNYNMLVEVDGDYYHLGNKETNKKLSKMQIKNKNNDRTKDTIAKAMGFSIERVFESDLKNNYEEVKNRFKNMLI